MDDHRFNTTLQNTPVIFTFEDNKSCLIISLRGNVGIESKQKSIKVKTSKRNQVRKQGWVLSSDQGELSLNEYNFETFCPSSFYRIYSSVRVEFI